MKKFVLPILLALFVAGCTIFIFSCDFLELEIEDSQGAKYQDDQSVVYKQTIYNPIE